MRFNYKVLLADIACFVSLYFIILTISPLSTPVPYSKYMWVLGLYSLLVIVFCALAGRYTHRLRSFGYRKTGMQYLSSSLISYALVLLLCLYSFPGHSIAVISIFTMACLLVTMFFQFCYFAYRYASDPEEVHTVRPRDPKQVLNPPVKAEDAVYEAAIRRIKKRCGDKALDFIASQVDLTSANTRVTACKSPDSLASIQDYRYDAIVDIFQLNNVRGINRLFATANNKLPDNGVLIGCFTPKAYVKKRILDKYPKGINWIVYTFFYIYRRVIPKLFITKRLYYDITKGRNRILSIAEVFGRLCYCGYEIVAEKRIEHRMYFVARRVKTPPAKMKRRYGPFISLNRVGKGGKMIKVYKMRTMYPYSEFLQDYIYKKNNLQEGGKFRHDIRVNTLGRFMRRCWIDELPMIVNLLKGDMKLIGVRPLSKQYFSLYSPELQQERTKYKPGLLPPYYVDMPKTLDEIQDSEMRYLKRCGEKGTFRTDWTYFWKIVYNIVFKHARSN